MDWIVTLITAILSGGAVSLVTAITNRRANKRLAETEADKAKIDYYKTETDNLHEQILRKDDRLVKAEAENEAKEERFRDQTKRLRECQDRELKSQQRLIELTAENGELKLILERHKCIKTNCPYKEPATDETRKARAELGITPSPEDLPNEDPQPELTTI